ncbi:MAG: hypothetical protein ACFFER_13600 [Candidatus Thorarchaeota archaeon]
MLTFTLESDNLDRILESMISYYPSLYRDLILNGNQLIAGIVVKEEIQHTVTIIFKIGEDSSVYNVTIIASGGYGRRELHRLEAETKEFIENNIRFFKKRDLLDWPCGSCGESYAYPVLSADGRYRCPKCAKPVDGALTQ